MRLCVLVTHPNAAAYCGTYSQLCWGQFEKTIYWQSKAQVSAIVMGVGRVGNIFEKKKKIKPNLNIIRSEALFIEHSLAHLFQIGLYWF